MQIILTGHHVDITEALRNFVHTKMAKLERHFDNVVNVHTVLTVEKLNHKAEASVQLGGARVFADAVATDMYAAIDALIEDWVQSQPQELLKGLKNRALRESLDFPALAEDAEQWPSELRDAFMQYYASASLYSTWSERQGSPRKFAAWLERHRAFFDAAAGDAEAGGVKSGGFLLPAFLDNHDMNRFLFVAGNDTATLKVAVGLLLALAALMAFGLAVLYSAGGAGSGPALIKAQGARFALGLMAMWALSRVSVIRLRAWSPPVYLLSLLPLVAVLLLGTGKHGRHWLNLGVFYLQPSELLKITLPMMVAWYLHMRPLPPRIGTVLVAGVLIAVPTGLILLQPDFGTAMLIAASGVFALLLAGLPWWWVGVAVGGVAAVAPVAWIWLLRPYQKDRILTFLEPERDPLGTGWNIIQSKIAIGSGGLSGKGWGEGSQSHLNFIPEQTTDFIFAVLSEEFGWIGVATVLALYLFVVGRCLWIAVEARDTYSRLLAGSLGLAFFVYVLVNGGMVSGLLPVVGVPMPLLSYGGTSAVSLLAGLGLVMAVRTHRPVHGYR